MENRSRSQDLELKTGKKRKYIICLIVVIALIIAGLLFFVGRKAGQYVPPEYDINAVEGIPTVEDSFMYNPIDTKYGYKLYMAINTYQQEDQSVKVFFTNPVDTNVNAQMEIKDAKSGQTLYKSGVIKPGYYIESLKPCADFPNQAREINVLIYGFEPDTWYSMGTTEIGLMLQPW